MGAKKTPRQSVKSPEIPEKVVIVPRKRWPWYIGLCISLALLAACSLLALGDNMSAPEQQVFQAINGVSLPDWVTSQVARPLSDAVWGMVVLMLVMLLLPRFRLRAWQYVAAAGSAHAVATIIERLVDRARPLGLSWDVVPRAVQDGLGFPSTHVAIVAALGVTAWFYVSWPWRLFLVILVGSVAWSRVFLGVHAPLDVAGGLAIGLLVVSILHLLPRKIRAFFRLGL